jgi:Penicillin V acylase and related amidases
MHNQQTKLALSLVLAAAVSGQLSANACTDFAIKATDGTVVCGRSMEWAGADMNSRVRVHAPGETCTSTREDGSTAHAWTSKFAYGALDGYGLDVALDGINSKGLSVGCLWLPGTVYETAKSDQASIDILDLGKFLLGTCANIDDVKESLKNLKVTGKNQSAIGAVPTVHVALHDASGKHAVIECVDGERKFTENPNGVLTNAPTIDWHLTNLRNYLNISPSNPKPIEVNGKVVSGAGQGFGFVGIPGDWTPSSRFVRTTAMIRFAQVPSDTKTGVNLAQHVLNAVDIPKGDVRTTDGGPTSPCDFTQWAVVKDLTNKALYLRTYDDLSPRKFDLSNLETMKTGFLD